MTKSYGSLTLPILKLICSLFSPPSLNMLQALICLSTARFTWSGKGFSKSRCDAFQLTSGVSGASTKKNLKMESWVIQRLGDFSSVCLCSKHHFSLRLHANLERDGRARGEGPPKPPLGSNIELDSPCLNWIHLLVGSNHFYFFSFSLTQSLANPVSLLFVLFIHLSSIHPPFQQEAKEKVCLLLREKPYFFFQAYTVIPLWLHTPGDAQGC